MPIAAMPRPQANPLGGAVLAGFGERLLAQLIDVPVLLVLIGPIGVLGALANGTGELSQGGELMLDLIAMLVVLLFWVTRQATPGKQAMRLRIVDAATGGPPGLPQLVTRYFGYIVASLPLGLGYFWILWDPRRQGWHDKLARTLVLRVPR